VKAMILAAGLGTRMRPLTLTTPKPLVPVNGKPLIEYHLESLAKAGFSDIVINHAWLGQKIEDALGDGDRWEVSITYSRELAPLETGGGIAKALPLLSVHGEPFLVINGDVLTDFDYCQLAGLQPDRAHLVLVANPEHNLSGDFDIDEKGAVHNPEESLYFQGVPNPKVARSLQRYTFSGVSVINPALFDHVVDSAFSVAPLFRDAAKKGRLTGQVYQGLWMDIGTMDRLEKAEQILRKTDAT